MLHRALQDEKSAQVAALSRSQKQSALHILTLAFEKDPPCRWLFPEDGQYRRHFPAFARAFGGAAIDQGTALATLDGSGIALWLAPGEGPDEEALAALIEDSVTQQRKLGVFALFAEMAQLHPTETHWYLPLIGVEPGSQGQGLGSTLLRPILAQCDATGMPAYLEATSRRSVPLYARHGFEPLDEIRIGDCPPIVPMLRRPHGRSQ